MRGERFFCAAIASMARDSLLIGVDDPLRRQLVKHIRSTAVARRPRKPFDNSESPLERPHDVACRPASVNLSRGLHLQIPECQHDARNRTNQDAALDPSSPVPADDSGAALTERDVRLHVHNSTIGRGADEHCDAIEIHCIDHGVSPVEVRDPSSLIGVGGSAITIPSDSIEAFRRR
jgi:hypothetical protein